MIGNDYPVRAWSEPTAGSWRNEVRAIECPGGTMIVVGETHADLKLGVMHEFVEVLLPIHCYINRTLFNEGMGYIQRIS